MNVKVFGFGWDNSSFVDYHDLKNLVLTTKINLNLSNSAPDDYRMISFFIIKTLKEIFFLKKFKKNFYRIIRAIKLKFFYKKNVEQIKARNFEINAFNGFQITNHVKELEAFFNDGEDIIYFKNIDDLVEKCSYFLEHNEEREVIKEKGFKNSSKHTYKERFKKIFKQIDDFN